MGDVRVECDGIGRKVRVFDVKTGEELHGITAVSWRHDVESGLWGAKLQVDVTFVPVVIHGEMSRLPAEGDGVKLSMWCPMCAQTRGERPRTVPGVCLKRRIISCA